MKKKDERNLYKECIEAIHQQKPFINVRNDASSLYLDTTALEVFILKWHMEQGVKVCKSKIKNISISYLQLEYDKRYENLEEIYYYIMK